MEVNMDSPLMKSKHWKSPTNIRPIQDVSCLGEHQSVSFSLEPRLLASPPPAFPEDPPVYASPYRSFRLFQSGVWSEVAETIPTKTRSTPNLPLKFRDAIGRKFAFPWHLCSTWKGMERLIRQAFLVIDTLRPHVKEGQYLLVGPKGEIIQPQFWETIVQPGWSISMHMWPLSDQQPTPLSPHLIKSLRKSRPKTKMRSKHLPPSPLPALCCDSYYCNCRIPRPFLSAHPRARKSNKQSMSSTFMWLRLGGWREQSLESDSSYDSADSDDSDGSTFSQASATSSCSENTYFGSTDAENIDEPLAPKYCFESYPTPGLEKGEEVDRSSCPTRSLYGADDMSDGNSVPDSDVASTESEVEESLFQPFSIPSSPSQEASSRTSFSENTSEDSSSQSSSTSASLTQDTSSLASLDPDSEPSSEAFLSDSLSSSKSSFIDGLMRQLHVAIRSIPNFRTCPDPQGGRGDTAVTTTQSSNVPPQQSGTVSVQTVQESRGWQKDTGDNDGEDDDDDDDARRHRKTPSKLLETAGAPDVRLACPFFKYNPRQHKGRSCRYPGFKGIHRVKEHLYRCHVPIHCNRCHSVFQTDDELQSHQRLAQACAINSSAPPEGLCASQIARLKSKKKFGKEKTEEEKWRAIYHFLFPGVPVMSVSPYCDDLVEPSAGNELDEFEIYSRREFPRRVRQRLDSLYDSLAIDTTMRAQMVNIADQCREEIFSDFQQRQQPELLESPENPGGSPDPQARQTAPSETSEIQSSSNESAAMYPEASFSGTSTAPTFDQAESGQFRPNPNDSGNSELSFLQESPCQRVEWDSLNNGFLEEWLGDDWLRDDWFKDEWFKDEWLDLP